MFRLFHLLRAQRILTEYTFSESLQSAGEQHFTELRFRDNHRAEWLRRSACRVTAEAEQLLEATVKRLLSYRVSYEKGAVKVTCRVLSVQIDGEETRVGVGKIEPYHLLTKGDAPLLLDSAGNRYYGYKQP